MCAAGGLSQLPIGFILDCTPCDFQGTDAAHTLISVWISPDECIGECGVLKGSTVKPRCIIRNVDVAEER